MARSASAPNEEEQATQAEERRADRLGDQVTDDLDPVETGVTAATNQIDGLQVTGQSGIDRVVGIGIARRIAGLPSGQV